MGHITNSIVLPNSGMDRLLAKIHLADDVKRVNKERQKVETRLKKLGQLYLDDDDMDQEDYRRRKEAGGEAFRSGGAGFRRHEGGG